LPIELCEAVMDAIPASPHFLTRDEYDTLVACKNVCDVWSTRARTILDMLVHLDSPEIVSLFVSATRRESADRTNFISTLLLNWYHVRGEKNLSRAMDLFMLPLQNFQALYIEQIRIDLSPRILRMRLLFFTGIEHLFFHHCDFYSWRAMLDFAWACPNLTHLYVYECSFGADAVTPESAARLSAARRNLRGCQNVGLLHISVRRPCQSPYTVTYTHCHCLQMLDHTWRLLPGDVFGAALTRLMIYYRDTIESHTHITSFLRGTFPQLRDIGIVIE
ncbi:hypothetical protein C8Q79DRAFT_882098, partial [Trametes meyenii]